MTGSFSFLLAFAIFLSFLASFPTSLSKVSKITCYNCSFIWVKFVIICLNTLYLASNDPYWHFVLSFSISSIAIYDLLIWMSLCTGADNNSDKLFKLLLPRFYSIPIILSSHLITVCLFIVYIFVIKFSRHKISKYYKKNTLINVFVI